MNQTFFIRNYKKGDKESLRQLVIESNIFQKSVLEKEAIDIDKVKEETSDLFDRTLQHQEDQHYFVAEVDGKLVGFILIEASKIYVGRGSIDDLYIQDDYRGEGLGKTLLQHALGWLKNRGVKRIGLAVHKTNRAAISLYKNAGFIEEAETYLSLEKEVK